MTKWLSSMKPYSKEELKAMLPKVGDVLMRKQTIGCTSADGPTKPRSCKVVYVNEEHLYYRVQFRNGCYECFKVPDIKMEGRCRQCEW